MDVRGGGGHYGPALNLRKYSGVQFMFIKGLGLCQIFQMSSVARHPVVSKYKYVETCPTSAPSTATPSYGNSYGDSLSLGQSNSYGKTSYGASAEQPKSAAGSNNTGAAAHALVVQPVVQAVPRVTLSSVACTNFVLTSSVAQLNSGPWPWNM